MKFTNRIKGCVNKKNINYILRIKYDDVIVLL